MFMFYLAPSYLVGLGVRFDKFYNHLMIWQFLSFEHGISLTIHGDNGRGISRPQCTRVLVRSCLFKPYSHEPAIFWKKAKNNGCHKGKLQKSAYCSAALEPFSNLLLHMLSNLWLHVFCILYAALLSCSYASWSSNITDLSFLSLAITSKHSSIQLQTSYNNNIWAWCMVTQKPTLDVQPPYWPTN